MNILWRPIFFVILFAQVILGLSLSTFVPSEQISLTDLDENRKAESYGIVGFIRGIGLIPTGFIGGFLIGNVHYIAPFVISFIFIFFEIWFLIKYFQD